VTTDTFLFHAVVYLGAAVLLVPLAARLGLGSVLGYLVAGVVIGPGVLNLVGEDPHDVMQFAEFGIVMMLFLVGLELDPGRLWRMRGPVLGLGGLQVGATALAVTPIAMLSGLPWNQGLALGLGVAMSSTAIALQSLTEKGLLRTPAGQTSFAVLLFQDVAVIPILALFPLLVTPGLEHGGAGGHGGGATFVEGLSAWQHALVVLGAVVGVIAVGRIMVGPLLRLVARSRLRELFTATSLLLVVAVAFLMTTVGLSAALGTFLAGVVLANSEYRHELVADVEPFKGLLLGLFFIAVGATIDFGVLFDSPGVIALLVVVAVVVKLAVLAAVARTGQLSANEALLFAVSLSQIGEFAFVLFSVALTTGVLPASVTTPMTAVTAFSMAATPLLLTLLERFVLPRLGRAAPSDREADVMDENDPVIVAGYGRFGQIVGRLLRSHRIPVTVLDVDSEQVDVLRKFGQKVFYGDASRLELLHAAGAERAKVLVVAVDDSDKALEITRSVRRHFPHLAILARARGRTEAYDLLDEHVEGVYRETFDTAVHTGEDALRLLGFPAAVAHRMARAFRIQDERAMRELAQHRNDEQFVSKVRERIAEFERLMRAETQDPELPGDDAWDSEVIRQGVLATDAEAERK
jgi:monovalent cation:proton antiporter-2 (CPA2) family protein